MTRLAPTRLLVAALLLLAAAPAGPASAQNGQTMAYLGHVATGGGVHGLGARVAAVAVGGRYAYLAVQPRSLSLSAHELRVFDVGNPAAVAEVGQLTFPDLDYRLSIAALALQGSYLYLATCSGPYELGRLLVVDLSDPTRPSQVASVETSYVCGTALAVAGRYAYVASGIQYMSGASATLDVFDLVDPARPTRVGSLGRVATASFAGVAVSGGYAYVADTHYGLRVVDISDPTRPSLVALEPGGTGATAVVLSGSRAYVSGATLRVVDLADPRQPRVLGVLGERLGALAVQGTTVYAAAGEFGLRVVDASDPSRPFVTATSSAAATAGGVAAANGQVFLGDGGGALWVLRGPVAAATPEELPPRAYLGVALQNGAWSAAPGRFTASLVVMNRARASARVVIWLLDEAGARATGGSTYQVGPGASQLVYLPSLSRLPDGRYSVVVASDEPVLAQANLLGAAGSAASYEGQPPTAADRVLFVPGAFKTYFGYSSTLTLQNPNGVASRTTVAYRDGSGAVVATQTLTVPAHGTTDLPLPSAPLPDGFVGAATIAGDAPMLASAAVAGAAGELGVARAQSAAPGYSGTALPSLYKSYSADGWVSSILLQNLAGTPSQATLQFRRLGSVDPIDVSVTVPAYGLRQLYLDTLPQLPDGFAGSAIVRQSGGQVLASVNTRNARGNFSTYAGPAQDLSPAADSAVYLPSVYSDYSPLGWSSSLVLQNFQPSPATVEISYYDASGLVRTVSTALQEYETRLHYQPDPREGLPPGFHGSAIVRSGGPYRVGVVANVLARAQGSGDWLLAYEGLTSAP